MNALHRQVPLHAIDPPGQGDMPWPDAAAMARLTRTLAIAYLALSFALLVVLALPGPLAPPLAFYGLGRVVLAAVLLPLAGLLATLPLARARAALAQPVPPQRASARFMPARLRRRPVRGRIERLSWLGRRPQGIIVPAIGAAAILAVWGQNAALPGTPSMLAGAGAIVLAFPLLVAERVMAAASRTSLPEAPSLQALLFIPALLVPLAGLADIMTAAGAAWARFGLLVLAAYLTLVAIELAARALANWFLPLPDAQDSRAAVVSIVALLLQPRRLAPDGLANPIREHLGIDFSRSWSLRYLRAAALPVCACLGLLAWALTGVTLVDLDRRGIYERMGAPVAVWAPGIHLGLPWPLGQVHAVDLGVVHAVTLGAAAPASLADHAGAEDPAPAMADRLWESEHPSEVGYLLASLDTSGGQSFQSVSVDARILYRTGLDDASAIRAAFAVAGPDDLVRAQAGRLLAQLFASQVLETVLGGNRETMADALRQRLQAELDLLGSGIQLVAVVIEAIHPPAGAAEAYHDVQAAEIVANTTISVERGRALTARSVMHQQVTDLLDGASGFAADTVAGARVGATGFMADQQAARDGGEAFLLERYFANLSTALVRSPLVIVDHRLTGTDAPVIDLRAFGAPPTRAGDED